MPDTRMHTGKILINITYQLCSLSVSHSFHFFLCLERFCDVLARGMRIPTVIMLEIDFNKSWLNMMPRK